MFHTIYFRAHAQLKLNIWFSTYSEIRIHLLPVRHICLHNWTFKKNQPVDCTIIFKIIFTLYDHDR